MAEQGYIIAGKVCPIMSRKGNEVLCKENCAMFYEYYQDKNNGYCRKEDAVKVGQGCRMWPDE